MYLVVWVLAAICWCFVAAVPAQAGDAQAERNAKAAIADPLIGRWFNEESKKFVVFDAGGEFIDSDRGPAGGRWMTFRTSTEIALRDKLRISELTLDGRDPYLCEYSIVGDKLTVGNVVVQSVPSRNCHLRDNSTGVFVRIKAVPTSPLVGKWLNRSSGSMIEFTRKEEFIIHDELWTSMIPGNWAVVGAGKVRLFIGDTGNSVSLICRHAINANQLTLSECAMFDGVLLRVTNEGAASSGSSRPRRSRGTSGVRRSSASGS